MKITSKDSSAALAKTDLLVVPALAGARLRLPAGVELPAAAKKEFEGKKRQVRQADALAGAATRVVLVGLGEAKDADAELLRRVAAIGVKKAEKGGYARCTIWVSKAVEKAVGGAEAAGRAAAEGARMGNYSFTSCKSKPKARKLRATAVCGSGAPFRRGVKRGDAEGAANCFVRDLQNTPGNLMRPRDMASEARKLARAGARISCTVLSEAQMAKLGMGSLLSVSRGSSEPAQLIHLRYKPKGRSKGRVAFVGKGLTFDAGGISLKPSAKMDEMRYDMSGGAAVLGVFHALGKLDVPFEVHGVVPASENLPDGKANKPGDIVTAMNGKTIEVLNTDAEGRLILADALAYTVKKVKPDTIIDIATLTGAVVVALGHEMSGMFPSTTELRDDLSAAGEDCGERVWPLPLFDCHRDQMKGRVGDLRNINSGQGNGSTTGAAFLEHFIGDTPEWAHLDIAGAAWGTVDRDYVGGPFGTGVGTRLLLRFLENRS
jgi:leucyl aminopeptidase